MPEDDYNYETKIAVAQIDIEHIKETLDSLDKKLSLHYITKYEFEPVRNIVYGIVSLVLVAVVGALIALVLQPGPPPAEKTEQTKTTQQ